MQKLFVVKERKMAAEHTDKLLRLCSKERSSFSLDELTEVLTTVRPDDIDKTDKDKMTSLMHCAYRGNTEGCLQLLKRNANINLQQETDEYTPLMFATIAGCTETVAALLAAGADTGIVNKIGKTAAQLGSFVGQHSCVQVINNYFSLSDLHSYTSQLKADGQPRLNSAIAPYLHSLLITTQVHPVHLVLYLRCNHSLLEAHKDVSHVLDKVCKDMMSQEREGFSLKAHYLAFLVSLCLGGGGADTLLKRLLTFTETGLAVEMDLVLRQCLREFPHRHSVLLKQLVGTVAKVDPGGPPSALSLFMSVIVGEKTGAEGCEEQTCSTCGLVGNKLKKCSKCKQVYYCSLDCQKLAWSSGNHRKLCKKWCQEANET